MRRVGKFAIVFQAVALLALSVTALVGPSAHAGLGKVLVLGPTVSGGESSKEATYLSGLGYTVDVVDDATWGGMSADDFGSYRAIVLGDPTCGSEGSVSAAAANAGVWGPKVTGEVILIGTDPVYHYGTGQAQQLIEQGLDFAVSDPTKTGLYATLSCYYGGDEPGTPVPFLDGINGGGFTVRGTNCDDAVHITAEHPALEGLTDEGLTDWGCSTHESFDTWPAEFAPLAMAVQADGRYVAPDGTRGEVYILARGVDVIRALTLTPESATNPVGTAHTVNAHYEIRSQPQVGAEVTFTVTDGPHAGVTGTATTDADGNASFTYTGTSPGTDSIVATTTLEGFEIESNVVTKTWVQEESTTTTAASRSTTAVTPRFTG